jgi:phenylacetate-CoA ligase
MSDELIREFLRDLNRFRPRYINGYASSLYLIARTISESSPIEFRPAAVRSSAETLYGFQRREIEAAFGAKVYDFYGSREVNNLAVECPAHDGLHVFASGRIVEIVDERGIPVDDGELGQVAVTDLTNFSFPFIRYLNGDLAIRRDRPCSCDRGYPMIEKVCGRTTDMITINDQYIHGEFFTHLFYRKPDIRQFQVIQQDASTLRIRIVAGDGGADIADVLAKIREKVGAGVVIKVEFTNNIETTGTGKYRFTISRIAWAARSSGNGSDAASAGDDSAARRRP